MYNNTISMIIKDYYLTNLITYHENKDENHINEHSDVEQETH